MRVFDGLQQRAAEQVLLAEYPGLRGVFAACLLQTDIHNLPGVVPFVNGVMHIQALVTLQTDESRPQYIRHHFSDLGFSDAGLALEKKRAAQLMGQENRGRQPSVGDIKPLAEGRLQFVDRFDGHVCLLVVSTEGELHASKASRRPPD